MYFGSNGGHGHVDTLNLGLTAFGLNLLPDLGYPEQTGTQPNRLQWVSATLSHNTATVNGKSQVKETEIRGKLLHFDGSENVQVMDVSAPYVYDEASEYRRSVMTVYVDDENSYTVDFFRILGGNEHLLSIHAQSNEISETVGLDFTLIEDENGNYISGSQLDENGEYKANYKESMEFLEYYFPKDKKIFLMCGGGGYAGMTKKMLVSLGWDEKKIYVVGGYWYYEGKNKVEVRRETDGGVLYDFWKVTYHDINFADLTEVDSE